MQGLPFCSHFWHGPPSRAGRHLIFSFRQPSQVARTFAGVGLELLGVLALLESSEVRSAFGSKVQAKRLTDVIHRVYFLDVAVGVEVSSESGVFVKDISAIFVPSFLNIVVVV